MGNHLRHSHAANSPLLIVRWKSDKTTHNAHQQQRNGKINTPNITNVQIYIELFIYFVQFVCVCFGAFGSLAHALQMY